VGGAPGVVDAAGRAAPGTGGGSDAAEGSTAGGLALGRAVDGQKGALSPARGGGDVSWQGGREWWTGGLNCG
jgi:hypothetical protein